MPRADEILVWAGLDVPKGGRLANDSAIQTTCPTCGQTQTLGDARFEDGEESTYTCKNDCQPILVIGQPADVPWPGRGYRLKDWVLRNPADLTIPVYDRRGRRLPGTVLMPASPAALADDSERPDSD